MKNSVLSMAFALPFAALFAATPAVPKAPVITYGLIRDEYGSPLTAAALATARLVKDAEQEGRLYALSPIAPGAYPGMNYRLSLEIDSKGPTRREAVVKGTAMRVQVMIGGEQQQLTPSPVFTTPAAGTAQRLDFSIAEDEDGDGLPDAWEYWMMELNPKYGEDGQPESLEDFDPNADYDGDGMSNLHEFYAGTDPFIATDLLKVTDFVKGSDGKLSAVSFTSTRGHRYQVLMTESLENPNWTPVAMAETPAGNLVYGAKDGTGRTMTVYIDPALNNAFFKVACD